MHKNWLCFIFVIMFGLFVGGANTSPAFAYEEDRTAGSMPVMVDLSPEEAITPDTKPAKEETSFPQLRVDTYPTQVFWLFVFFTLLYVLMSKLALPRVEEVLNMRQSQQSNNLNRAAALQEDAAKVEKEYESALATAHDAAQVSLRDAEQKIADKISSENEKFAEKSRTRLAEAEKNIQAAKDKALSSLADISAEVAAEMVNKITGAQLTKADAKKSVTAVMQEGA